MSEVTVKQLANTVGIPVERLLSQLKEAGVAASDGDQVLSEQEKMQLLSHLRRSHGKKAEGGGVPGRITLRRKSVTELRQPVTGTRSTGQVRAATRTKTVSVEVRRKRTYVKRTSVEPSPAQEKTSARAARNPLEEVRRRETLEARRAEEEARRLAEREEQERKAREEQERRRAEEEARRRAEEEAKQRAEEEAKRRAEEEARRKEAQARTQQAEETVSKEKPTRSKSRKAAAKGTVSDAKGRKRSEGERERSAKKAARKDALRARDLPPEIEYEEEFEGELSPEPRPTRKKRSKKPQDKHGLPQKAKVVRKVEIPESIPVSDLAARMSVKAAEVIQELFKQGVAVTINQSIDRDTAILLVEEMGHIPVPIEEEDLETRLMAELEQELKQAEEKPRPPVVTIMGHVDHGKTSLLDFIRRTRVAAKEAGGITQHIGAYHVRTDQGTITFLDTPGHEAFSAMRARGARVTDIVVLVVAADDGVMPQTVEAIQHARASDVPIIVAINKIDKPDANPDRVMQELTRHEIVPEEWGGDTMAVQVSAKTGAGIDELLDAILLQAELLELRAPVEGPARGTIIESSLDRGRGYVATVLVQAGTLRRGDTVVSGTAFGRVRALFDENGRAVKEAGPSIPVQLLGLSGAPNAGEALVVVREEKQAREVAQLRAERERKSKLEEQRAASLDQLFSQLKEGEVKTVNLLLKADVQGSLEALRESLLKLSTEEVQVNIVGAGVGGITESDANLAVTTNAILLGFNVRADAAARRVIEEKGLDLRYYSVIYELIQDVEKALSGLLSPEISEEIIGLAQVREVFRSSKFGTIAGCMVLEGVIKRNNPIRVLRDNVVIYEGVLESLRRFKEDVQEVKAGMECGVGVKHYNDVRVGDQIEVFERTEKARTL